MEKSPLDRAIEAMLGDSSLWPVLIVCVLVLATFLAGIELLALHTRNLLALVGLGALVLLSIFMADTEIRPQRRMTPGAWAIAIIWLTSLLVAAALTSIGAF